MRLQRFTLIGMIGYFGFFIMGNIVSEFIIPWLITSQTIPPEGIPGLATAVITINVLLYAMVAVFYFGYFRCLGKEQNLLRIICVLGCLVSLGNILNGLFAGEDYSLSMALNIMLMIMTFAVNLGFLATTIRLYPKDKFILIFSILAMLPFSTSSLFLGILFWRIHRDQINGIIVYNSAD